MILPIIAYGDPVLKKEAEEISKDYPALAELIENMFETMYNAKGVGLAAPQIGKSIRLFVVDGEPMDEEELKGFKKVFINPEILEEEGEKWEFNEGCLSIPDIRGEVSRHGDITIDYFDENFEQQTERFSGLKARIIQHEYDHIEGILFTDYFTPLKRQMMKRKLDNISKGKIDVEYRMKFPKEKRR